MDVPVIGIGAGNGTDGQILVMHDMFGIFSSIRCSLIAQKI
ncbi:3-methyl-2-oxobutanoate hydroxymethyltransferase [Vibrio cholerae]|nr:3-methyl-2-oxobutanoate hydroxymethyltransferase [Vibrio cholerae]